MKKVLLSTVLAAGVLQHAQAQNQTITGQVIDQATGQGIPGATVLVKGTTIGISTDQDGSFRITPQAPDAVLVFSSIGYASQEVRPTGTTVSVRLASDTKQLGEVVVTGALGLERQARELGYSTATVQSKDLNQARVTNVTNGLAGKVAGLQIQTINNGVNPNVRVTLRGTRSLTGENQALVVIDGVQQYDSNILTTLNPDDIAEITVLKGANAAALYGSSATNGALIVTTKRGGNKPAVTFSHTSQLEEISFWPKLQNEFGPGSDEWEQIYSPYENQQYGDRYDGSIRELGRTTESGNIQKIVYQARPNERKNFFNTGYQRQNNVSFSGGDDKTKIFVSYQNLKNSGIVPNDEYQRNTLRANASRELGRLTAGFNVSYAQVRTNVTTAGVYNLLLNASSLVPMTQYKDWRNNEFANPNGYFNEYAQNPYFALDNNRSRNRQDFVVGNLDLTYKIADWLSLQYRLGVNTSNQSSKSWQDKFTYSAFTLGRPGNARANIAGAVTDLTSYQTQINSDAFVNVNKEFGDFSVKAVLGNNVRQYSSQYLTASANALSVPGVFNIASNRVGELTGDQADFRYRQVAFFGDLTLGYKNFLFLHGSGRQEGISILDPEYRSYFYPAVDASLVFTELLPGLKSSNLLDYGKLRAGYSKVGQVNFGSTAAVAGVAPSYGAYRLQPVFGPGSGFPFGTLASYTISNQQIVPNLQPEFTYSFETGAEISLLRQRISLAATYYNQRSINQALAAGISPATGFTSLLLNAGEVQNNGVELELNVTPVETQSGFTWKVGANYNYNNNEVIKITDDINELALTSGGNAQVYAIKGQPYPVLRGSYYERDENGRVKLTYINLGQGRTGYVPTRAADNKLFGNTLPKHIAGFNTNFSFKGLTLAAQAEYRTGYYVYHDLGATLDFTGGSARSAQYGRQPFLFPNSSVLESGNWVPNTSFLTPGGAEFWANTSYNRSIAENYVTKGDFFKIREVSLSYNLPSSLLTKAVFVKAVSLNVFGRNLYTWVPKENQFTDPEFSFTSGNGIGINTVGQTPPTRLYGATISATF